MSAKIHPFITEYWKIDGGICFGVIAKSTWSKLITPDENNLIFVASRCLFIESGARKILIDTGIGNKFDEKFYAYHHRSEVRTAAQCILDLGFDPEEVTDVIFTHLHWDHVGGATYKNDKGESALFFPNATHWCSKAGWEWALNPSPREKKAFYKEDLFPLMNSEKLRFIEEAGPFDENIHLSIMNGHTIGQLIPTINTAKGPVIFSGDFIPSKSHIPVPYTPSQDIQPLITMNEKISLYDKTADQDFTLIFQHDSMHECCKIISTEKGFQGGESFIWKN